jgi:hypothetical protein
MIDSKCSHESSGRKLGGEAECLHRLNEPHILG